MIRPYQFIATAHLRLHSFVMDFFLACENNTQGFNDALFDPEFLPIVNRHKKILKKEFKKIYQYLCTLSQEQRSSFIREIIDSNEIEAICRGDVKPKKLDNKCNGINKAMRDLFIKLYEQVLDGKPFRDNVKVTLRQHFDEFSRLNENITLCPICGIGELKKAEDDCRDQYDHYLPKALYPYSTVNFKNLVPCCRECNSFDVKGDKDILEETSGKVFFPYDEAHKGIALQAKIDKDAEDAKDIDWSFEFSNPDNKADEIDSWKTIYNIEGRYRGYVKARIKSWYNSYFEYLKNPKLKHLPLQDRKLTYMVSLEEDEKEGLNFIRRPVLDSFFSESVMVQAELEAMEYS